MAPHCDNLASTSATQLSLIHILIAIIQGTDVHTVTSVLLKLSRHRRYQGREITLDMAPNMEQIARICFPAAKRAVSYTHLDVYKRQVQDCPWYNFPPTRYGILQSPHCQ